VDFSLILACSIVADVATAKLIPQRRRVARFVCMSIFFAFDTLLVIALIGSPLYPTVRPPDSPRTFWLQILTCCWWALAGRELISFLALLTALRQDQVLLKAIQLPDHAHHCGPGGLAAGTA
jgi:hypothetical protein